MPSTPGEVLKRAAAVPSRSLDLDTALRRGRARRSLIVAVGTVALAAIVAAGAAVYPSVREALDDGAPQPPASACEPTTSQMVSAFLADDATGADVDAVRAYLVERDGVASHTYVSRRQAFAEFKEVYKDQPEFWAELPPRALPASFRITLEEDAPTETIMDELSEFDGVEQVAGPSAGMRDPDGECGSLDDDDPDGGKESGDLEEFCNRARNLDRLQRAPNDDELDGFLQAAPDPIREEAELLVASAREFRAGNDEAASSSEVQEAGDRLDEYLRKRCPA